MGEQIAGNGQDWDEETLAAEEEGLVFFDGRHCAMLALIPVLTASKLSCLFAANPVTLCMSTALAVQPSLLVHSSHAAARFCYSVKAHCVLHLAAEWVLPAALQEAIASKGCVDPTLHLFLICAAPLSS